MEYYSKKLSINSPLLTLYVVVWLPVFVILLLWKLQSIFTQHPQFSLASKDA